MNNIYRDTQLAKVGKFMNAVFPVPLTILHGRAFLDIRLQHRGGNAIPLRYFRSIASLLVDYDELVSMAQGEYGCLSFRPSLEMRLPTNELLEGAWCTWCNHGMRDDQQIAHMARMSNDQLDVTIVRTDGAIAGYVLLDSFCDDMKKIHMVNSLLQERFRVSPEDNTLPPRGNEYMLLPSVICYDYEEEEEEEEEGQLEPIVCQVMRQSKVRYDIDELLKELRRHRWNVPQIIEAENYMCW